MKEQSPRPSITASETARFLLTPQQASVYLNGLYAPGYLAQLRRRSPDNPKFRKINGRTYYHKSDLDKLLEGAAPEVREARTDDKR
ncbi:MAG: hypothetical protein HQK57_13550 [Deltaproteobacteria bacterium]|nr:hypothetical protein [Deltaproteobacteria bacterium]